MRAVVACVCSCIWKVGGFSLQQSLVCRVRGSIRVFTNILECSGRQAGALQGPKRHTKWIFYCFSGNKSVFVTWLLINKKLIKASARCMPLAPNIGAKANRPAQLLSRLICAGMRACVTGGRGRFIVCAWALKARVLGGRGHW